MEAVSRQDGFRGSGLRPSHLNQRRGSGPPDRHWSRTTPRRSERWLRC